MDLKETELTLGLPGKSSDHETEARGSMKRNLKTRSQKSEEEEQGGEAAAASSSRYSTDATPSSSEGHQLVGWPPVKASRAGMMNKNSSGGCKYVKVAVDGAPYLRKVDLERYDGYAQLLQALQDLFPPFTVRNYYFSEGYTLMDGLVPTFEDKDGDWMMVGDFPWKMFKESCKRIRLMKNSEAIGSD